LLLSICKIFLIYERADTQKSDPHGPRIRALFSPF